jgi:hypothetical protein
LFDWIDRTNYSIVNHVQTRSATGHVQALPATALFPPSLRHTLLQAYVHKVRWMAVPARRRRALRQNILTRIAGRFCRAHTPPGPVRVLASIQRIRPDNAALTQGRERLVMEFQCRQNEAILCRSLLGRHSPAACQKGERSE